MKSVNRVVALGLAGALTVTATPGRDFRTAQKVTTIHLEFEVHPGNFE